jgi:hypothetical protein
LVVDMRYDLGRVYIRECSPTKTTTSEHSRAHSDRGRGPLNVDWHCVRANRVI